MIAPGALEHAVVLVLAACFLVCGALEQSTTDDYEDTTYMSQTDEIVLHNEGSPTVQSFCADDTSSLVDGSSATAGPSARAELSSNDEPSPADETSLNDEPSLKDEPSPADEPSPKDKLSPTDIPSPMVEPSPPNEPSPIDETFPTDELSPTDEPSITDEPSAADNPSPADERSPTDEIVPTNESVVIDKISPNVTDQKQLTTFLENRSTRNLVTLVVSLVGAAVVLAIVFWKIYQDIA